MKFKVSTIFLALAIGGTTASAAPIDSFLGCYKTVTISGGQVGNQTPAISKIYFSENKDGRINVDPLTNKPIPFYRVDINSGYLFENAPFYLWTMAFTDRGTWSGDENNLSYSYEGQIVVLKDANLPGGQASMTLLLKLNLKKIAQGNIEATTEWLDLGPDGYGHDCRDYGDCHPLIATAALSKISCQ